MSYKVSYFWRKHLLSLFTKNKQLTNFIHNKSRAQSASPWMICSRWTLCLLICLWVSIYIIYTRWIWNGWYRIRYKFLNELYCYHSIFVSLNCHARVFVKDAIKRRYQSWVQNELLNNILFWFYKQLRVPVKSWERFFKCASPEGIGSLISLKHFH